MITTKKKLDRTIEFIDMAAYELKDCKNSPVTKEAVHLASHLKEVRAQVVAIRYGGQA